MSWMEQLVQTYNENEQFAGKVGAAGMKTFLPLDISCRTL